jgi:hypothetical protein
MKTESLVSMTSIEIVQCAYEVLKDEKHWTRGHMAVDQEGVQCADIQDPEAEMFCLMGALERARGRETLSDRFAYQDALFAVLKFVPQDQKSKSVSMSLFNDRPETTHAMVLGVLRQAEELLERKGHGTTR